MKRKIMAGTTSLLERVFVRDTSQTSKVAGLTGLTSGSAGLTLYYCRAGANATTAVSLSGGTLGTWSSGGFVEVDATHMPGLYEVGIPNAVVGGGSSGAVLLMRGAANMEDIPWQYELDQINYQDAVRAGLTALPNANAAASGGLPTAGTGANQISLDGTGKVHALDLGGLAPPANFNLLTISAGGAVTSAGIKIEKNTALAAFTFVMVQSSDHVTAATGLTVTAQRSLNAGSFGACTNAVSEVGSGVYAINLSAADLNADSVVLKFTATGADARIVSLFTQTP